MRQNVTNLIVDEAPAILNNSHAAPVLEIMCQIMDYKPPLEFSQVAFFNLLIHLRVSYLRAAPAKKLVFRHTQQEFW